MLWLLQTQEVREIFHTIHTYRIQHAPKYIGEYFPDLMGRKIDRSPILPEGNQLPSAPLPQKNERSSTPVV